MFDFQMDIFETIMLRFRHKMEAIIQSDFALEAKEENGVFIERFRILKTDDNCILYWAPLQYLMLDLYPALQVEKGSPESMQGLQNTLGLIMKTARDYALTTVALVVGPVPNDDVRWILKHEGFWQSDERSDTYIASPVPSYMELLRKSSRFDALDSMHSEPKAMRAVRSIPRLVTDVDVYRRPGNIRTMDLQRL